MFCHLEGLRKFRIPFRLRREAVVNHSVGATADPNALRQDSTRLEHQPAPLPSTTAEREVNVTKTADAAAQIRRLCRSVQSPPAKPELTQGHLACMACYSLMRAAGALGNPGSRVFDTVSFFLPLVALSRRAILQQLCRHPFVISPSRAAANRRYACVELLAEHVS